MNASSIILLVVVMLALVAFTFMQRKTQKKEQEKFEQLVNSLKKGDKVVTNAGIYGEIVSMKQTNMGKVVLLKTGDDEGKKVSYISINAQVILGIDEKHDVVLNENGEPVEPEEAEKMKEEVMKPVSEQKEEQKEEQKTEKKEEAQPKTEKKPRKIATKTTSKKEKKD